MKKEQPWLILSFCLVLVGIATLAEAAILLTVLQQITPLLTQMSSLVAWGYAILKIVTGLACVVSGTLLFLKLR